MFDSGNNALRPRAAADTVGGIASKMHRRAFPRWLGLFEHDATQKFLGLVVGAAPGWAPPLRRIRSDVAAPPLPTIRGLELRPAQLTLTDTRDERRVLVLGKTDGSNFVDLTAQAVFKTESPARGNERRLCAREAERVTARSS